MVEGDDEEEHDVGEEHDEEVQGEEEVHNGEVLHEVHGEALERDVEELYEEGNVLQDEGENDVLEKDDVQV